MLKNAYGPEGAYETDKEYEVSGEVATLFIEAEAALLIEGELPKKKKVK